MNTEQRRAIGIEKNSLLDILWGGQGKWILLGLAILLPITGVGVLKWFEGMVTR